ncbi:hypothetical protein DHEL01_v208366 [Diaporthe helianthi]|uniref:Uncharacterized protein n=1 Tax=Diaporthe helianthi TaxID=158607 RepID=A0A2P5HSM0_DIAHE|nr:hypothetical protein DHEL01_v208366 [Diaporthe helianthi]
MLSRSYFDNDAVAWHAPNPSSFGYHHGPVPHRNHQPANASHNADQQLPSIAVSKVNTGVCDLELDGTGTMCGTVFSTQPSMRRHLRDSHPGATQNPSRTNVAIMEKAQGQNAIKRWVLTGGWRDARYLREPGRGPECGLVARYADACERIAREDEEFRKKFGEHFHRRIMQQDPDFQPGKKSRARKYQEGAAEAEVSPAPPPPPPPAAGPSRSARSVPSQGRAPSQGRSGGLRGGRAKEIILISDDEDEEDVKMKFEAYTP